MSDLGLKPRAVWKQPDRLPAEGRLDSSKNAGKPRRCFFVVACLALIANMPLAWHSELSNLTKAAFLTRNLAAQSPLLLRALAVESTESRQSGKVGEVVPQEESP
jgi:hypothetical protein